MLIDREYPATHSMSTSWFAIDKDGQVALIEFNENGPVPPFVPEDSIEYIMDETFSQNDGNGVRYLGLTDDQAREMTAPMSVVTSRDDLQCGRIVMIDPAKTHRFLELCIKYWDKECDDYVTVCYSKSLGVYHLRTFEWSDDDIELLVKERIVLKQRWDEVDIVEKWSNEKGKWVFTPHADGYPFYIYKQPYSTDQLIERVHTPRYPLVEGQLPPGVASKGLRLPFSCATQDAFQIAQYYQVQSHDEAITTVDEGINTVEKYSYPLDDGREALFRDSVVGDRNCTLCNTCTLPGCSSYKRFVSTQFGIYPTVIFLYSPFEERSKYKYLYKLTTADPSLMQKYLWMPLLGGLPMPPSKWGYYETEDVMKQASSVDLAALLVSCKPHLYRDIRAVNPHCIVATPGAFKHMKAVLDIEDGKLIVGESVYPVFNLEEHAVDSPEIRQLAQLPYRGITVERIEPLNAPFRDDEPHD